MIEPSAGDHPSLAASTQEPSVEARERQPPLSDVIRLGWSMARLFSLSSQSGSEGSPSRVARDQLPTLGELSDREKIAIELARVKNLIHQRDLETGSGALKSLVEPGAVDRPPEMVGSWVRDCHAAILQELAGATSGLAKLRAYELGVSLGQISSRVDVKDLSQWADVRFQQLSPARELVEELTSMLPSHAAAAVSASMLLWITVYNPGPALEVLADALERQSVLWIMVLCGEKNPLGALASDDASAVARGELSGRELETMLGEAVTLGPARLRRPPRGPRRWLRRFRNTPSAPPAYGPPTS